MLHSSSNRGTPVSGENITKIVRQHYKPASPQPYSPEWVQCRTGTLCKKSKPDNYWKVNYHRRKYNLDKGFYTASTQPYRPIGGDLILDPYELVLSALPGNVEKKPRVTRRGTIYEPDTPTQFELEEVKSEGESSCLSEDLADSCPSAGYENIKRLLRESRERLVNVRAGMAYEDHVKQVEEKEKAELEANRPDDTDMVLHSLSSLCLPIKTKDSRPTSTQPADSRPISSVNKSPTFSLRPVTPVSDKSDKSRSLWKSTYGPAYSPNEKKRLSVVTHMDRKRSPSIFKPAPILKPASPGGVPENKLALIKCSSGITATLLRKERQFKDHLLYLKWIYNILTSLHNMKVKDIRTKVPLSKELVERLQKEGQCHREEERGSRGAYGCKWVMRKGCRTSNMSFKDIGGSSMEDNLSEFTYGYNDNSRKTPEVSATKQWPSHNKKPAVFSAAVLKKTALSKFGKSARASTVDIDNDDRYSVFGTIKRANAIDTIGKSFFGRRRSRNATSLGVDRPAVETWEDLLNIQPQEYKEKEETQSFGFQAGIVSKFMRWYRRASVTPTHLGSTLPNLEKDQVSQPTHEKGIQQEQPKESNYGITHQSIGSALAHTEKTKKLPIWQQVAQEKSVFHNNKSKAPNPDTAIQRFKRDLNKLKRSLQKENTAELEKLVRERVASFRLKFGTLNSEEASCLFEDQVHRIQDVRANVNKSHLENFDVQPSKWYEEVRERSTTMIASFDQPGIIEMINKLQTYAHMDNKTIPYAKAKLCLLMMSLPAYDICQIYVQRALKFIFENILLGTDAQFNEWLSHRKMPYMVLQDYQRPRSGATIVS